LVLHVFHAFGESGVAELDGDYSFVLWDSKKKKLLGFRDLTGAGLFLFRQRWRALLQQYVGRAAGCSAI